MKQKILFTFLLVGIGFSAFSQAGWEWSENPEVRTEEQRLYTLMNDSYKGGDFPEAKKHLEVLLEKSPRLNKSLYINGIKMYKSFWKNEKDPSKKKAHADQVMALYDSRFELFAGEEKKAIDRKAIDGFQFYYRDHSKTQFLLDLFKKAYELKGNKVFYPSAGYYMKMATLAKARGITMDNNRIMGIYETVTKSLDAQMEAAKSKNKSTKKLESTRELVDGELAKLGVIDCDFIVSNLVPEFEANPSDAELANKIFSFAFDGGCTDADWFVKAAERVFENNPNYGVGYLLGTRFGKEKDYDKSKEYFLKAVELTDDNTDKGKALKQVASTERIGGDYASARQYALKAIEADPSLKPGMYTLIGDMIMASFNDCAKMQSQVDDRAIYIAAYEMYAKAGNQSKMSTAKNQFPTIGDIFTAGKEEGTKVSVGCWINTTVALQRRPDQE